ncbi:MAG: ATP-binding protein [Alcanivoracaceae bacterium]|nr:ATP-binding protein [Alcanivoracaceae bacterium]
MRISRVKVGNFKGLGDEADIEIKPITLFLGANSSEKSSCMHGLACMAQTVKIANDDRPLILDSEYASVHLGRFIEVIHSRSYSDLITLGVEIEDAVFLDVDNDGKVVPGKGSISAIYKFKCSKRTQEVSLDSASISVGVHTYQIKKSGAVFTVTPSRGKRVSLKLADGFFFDERYYGGSNYGRPPREYLPFMSGQKHLRSALSGVHYLGPFRQPPQRSYPARGASPVEVGSMGESTVPLLSNEVMQKRKRPHIDQVSGWLADIGLADRLDISRVGGSDLFDVALTIDSGKRLGLADLGYGVSQILPVLAQCSYASKGATLLFEQPELHLHPLAAKRLGKVFVDTVVQKECNVVLETHSPELIRSLLVSLRNGEIPRGYLCIYIVSRDGHGSHFHRLEIDEENGFEVYENWERNFSRES